MRMLDLFSGIGGFSLAASWVWGDELEIVGFVEIDKFCQKVLKKHWPDVPIYEDIKELDGTQFKSVDLITGGFPCQPFSVAGKRKGKEDDRYLWPEMFRVIQEIKPHWVISENVIGIINMELDKVLSDLESEGYETETFIIPACGVDAPHRRNRVWIVANTNGGLLQRIKSENVVIGQLFKISSIEIGSYINDSWFKGLGNYKCIRKSSRVSNRVERLKSLGNAIVPQVVYPIMKAIKEIDESN